MSAEQHPDSSLHAWKKSALLRYSLAAVGLFVCFWSIWSAGRMGLSRMTASYASAKNLMPAADEAVNLGPSDPEAHYLRASMLTSSGNLSEGIREYERAAALRPLDYVLWMALGSARDENGDTEGALLAFREAVRQAPAYAEPHWQLGNVLLRANRPDEAFAEMRSAALSRPVLLPNFIDLVWSTAGEDAREVERVIRPETDSWRLILARFFVKRGKAGEALALYRAAGEASEEERQALLKELLAAKKFTEAYQVWKSVREEKRNDSATEEAAAITDGGFESGAKVNEPGFGWQLVSGNQMIRLSLDETEPAAGTKSLLLDWRGNVDAATPVLSQLVLVEAGARYRLHFTFRTKELSTGGPPVIVVSDAGGTSMELARSEP
ncbi:MAG TPA: tetratricopeptide repeat protein, partial [Pyrinomonadaceae bacterium]|nr:tetratricopeptide repeat protein [Pyrinomonadaceae bacterium]